MKWKRFLPKLHVYSGLLASGFLLMVSFSAFVQHHHPKWIHHKGKVKEWEQRIDMPQIDDGQAYKLAVRDSLHLFGHPPRREDYRDSLGIHHFMITRPGKQYWVTVPAEGDLFRIAENRTGILQVLNALHPLADGMKGNGKGPAFIGLWKWFAFLLGLSALTVVCLTLFFWLTRKVRRKNWWYYIIGAALVPITLFIMIWQVG